MLDRHLPVRYSFSNCVGRTGGLSPLPPESAQSHAPVQTTLVCQCWIWSELEIAVWMQLVSIIIVASGNLHNSTVTNLLQLLR